MAVDKDVVHGVTGPNYGQPQNMTRVHRATGHMVYHKTCHGPANLSDTKTHRM